MRSRPRAIPPWGGAPYRNASSRKPNALAWASPIPSARNTLPAARRVDADGATAELHAVHDHVVGASPHRRPGRSRAGRHPRAWRGERVVNGEIALRLLVPLQQRELGHPQEGVGVVGDHPEPASQLHAQRPERGEHDLRRTADGQEEVTLPCAARVQERREPWSPSAFLAGERTPRPSSGTTSHRARRMVSRGRRARRAACARTRRRRAPPAPSRARSGSRAQRLECARCPRPPQGRRAPGRSGCRAVGAEALHRLAVRQARETSRAA